MVKLSTKYICQQCEFESTKWFGKCPECGEWNSAVETVVSTASSKFKVQSSKRASGGQVAEPVSLSSIASKETRRVTTNISELDRVLGGGLVPGQVTLIAGEPGIGKSTILLQVANELTKVLKNKKTEKLKNREPRTESRETGMVLYSSGEESARQIKIRADRMGVTSGNIQILETTDVDVVIDQVERVVQAGKVENVKSTTSSSALTTPSTFLIVDSIQTMSTSDLSGMAGSVGQVRECAYRLVRFAKANNVPVFIVGHVTKTGSVAGPSVLMHIVDTVLWFEGDKDRNLRLLRAVKNRFGPTDEVGVFVMEDKGLVSQTDPEKLFLDDIKTNVSGMVTTCILQGTRPLLVEVQALVVPTKMAFAKRVAQGIDQKRFELLLAVLQRRCGIPLSEQDAFVNIAGGISLRNDPSADLAICLAIASAYFDKPVSQKLLAIGEVGLLGDIRAVPMQEKRVKESRRLGYKTIISNTEASYLREVIRKYLK